MTIEPDDPEELDRAVRLEVYRFFVESGRPPMPIDVALALATPSAEVEASFRRLADAHVLVLAPGTPYIWMANPLSALPSPYEVHARGRSWYGICIWDSLGVVAMLGNDGAVSTRCPDCGDELDIEVRRGTVSDEDCLVHYVVPAAHWWDDIGFN